MSETRTHHPAPVVQERAEASPEPLPRHTQAGSWSPSPSKRLWPGPYPRYRLYTQSRSYAAITWDIVSRRLASGRDVEALESDLSAFLGATHVTCVGMARVGIYLTIKSVIEPGQDVIMSPYTISDVVNMVIAAGGRPVFADIDRGTCNIDPAEVERLIGRDTGAVLVTHLHGLVSGAFEIREICRQYGVPMIEDAAQAFGAAVSGQRAGTIGDAGIYSFGMYKNINAWYGGAVVTENQELAEQIRAAQKQWAYQGASFIAKRMAKGLVTDVATHPLLFRPFVFWIFRYGALNDVDAINKRVNTELDTSRRDEFPEHYQAKMTPSQARLTRSQLHTIDEDIDARIHRAELYHDGLDDISEIILPPRRADTSHMYTYFPIQAQDRQGLLKWLMRWNRDAAAQHLKNCADLDSFSEFHRSCPEAGQTAMQTVLLPTYPRYPIDQVERTIETVRSYYGQ